MNPEPASPGVVSKLRKFLSGRDAVYLLLLVSLLAMVLLPYARSGLYADDSIASSLRGSQKITTYTLWQMIVAHHGLWLAKGRFYPLGLAAAFTHWYIAGASLPLERLIQLSLILINILLYARFIVRITGSMGAALMFVATLPLFFQVSAWVDPMTSFCPWLEITLLFIVLSIDSFVVSLETGGVVRLVLALFFFVCGLAVWEIVLMVTVLAAVLAAFSWRKAPRIALWGLGGYGLISVAFVGLNLYLKAHATELYTGTAIKLGAASVKTFFIQLTAAVPFTYFAWDANGVFHQNEWPDVSALLMALFIVATTTALVWKALMHVGSLRNFGLPALLVGGVLFVVPALFIAISERYQNELRWGMGYLPIYVEFFGLAGMVAVAVCVPFALPGQPMGRLAPVLAAVLGLLAGVGNAGAFLLNGITVETQNIAFKYPRTLIEQAIHHGLLDQVATGSTLWRDLPNMWDESSFYTQRAGRILPVATTAQLLQNEPDTFFGCRDFSGQSIYELRYAAAPFRDGGGWALLGRLQSLSFRKSGEQITLLDRKLTDLVGFKQEPALITAAPTTLTPSGLEKHGDFPALPRRVDRWYVPVESGKRWNLLKFSPGEYSAIFSAVYAELGFSPSARRPFLMRSSATGTEPAGTEGGPLEVADVEAAGKAPSRVTGIGFGCEREAESIAFSPEIESRLELRSARQAGGLGLAFRVWPAAAQISNAVLVCNHRADTRGFSLERAPEAGEDGYSLLVGDGKTWQPVGTVRLRAGRWNLVVINLAPEKSEIYAAGDTASHASAPIGQANVNEEIIYFGNWYLGDRYFDGRMKDFTWRPRAFTPAEVDRLLQDGVPPQSPEAATPSTRQD